MKHNNISSRRVLCLKGPDRFSFLQGLVTADLAQLSPGKITLSALLTPQGKIRYLFYIFCTDDALYLDCQEQHAPALLKQLSMFKLRANIDMSETDLNVYAGSQQHSLLPQSDIIISCQCLFMNGWRALSTVPPSTSGNGNQDWLRLRVKAGVPDMEDITPDKTIALEANLDCLGAVSWTKGCYMGQEVTARSHYRGLIKRRLAPVRLQKGTFPDKGGVVIADDDTHIPLLSRYNNEALVMLPRPLWSTPELSYEGERVLVTYPDDFIKSFLLEGHQS